jgi:hypothetical protein
MGLGTWLNEWGGKDVRGNIQDILNLDVVPGVCMWDLQLQADQWRQAETWQLLQQIRNINYATGTRETLPVTLNAGREKDVLILDRGTSFNVKTDGFYNIDFFNASGQLTKIMENTRLAAGKHRINIPGSNGIGILRIVGDNGTEILEKTRVKSE